MRPASPFGQDHRIQLIYFLDEILFLIDLNRTRRLTCSAVKRSTLVDIALFHKTKINTTIVFIIPLPMRLQSRLWLTKTDVISKGNIVRYLI